MKNILNWMTAISVGLLSLMASTTHAQELQIVSASDWGGAHGSYPASNAIDGSTDWSSRWAASGSPVNLLVNLDSTQSVTEVGVAWGQGGSRSHVFEIWARSGTSGSWTKVFDDVSSGNSTAIEVYNITDIDAQQVRVKTFSNSDGTSWTNITEVEVYGSGGGGAVTVPAKIEAEDFTDYSDTTSANQGGQYRTGEGVDIQTTTDAGGGYNVGWMVAGEWLEYEINVANSGNYEADLRLAATQSNRSLTMSIDGSQVTGTVSVNNTGNWQNFYTETVDLGNLSAGNHTLRLSVSNGYFNLNWIDIKSGGGGGTGDFGLNPNLDPWDNFDLSEWALDTPAPRPNDGCKAERTEEDKWDDSNPLSSASAAFFYTHTDGGMRFVSRIDGQTTSDSCSSGFVRSELREMLRAGDTNIDDTGTTANNWALGYQPSGGDYGGRNGVLNGTLRVNQVTTSGSSSQIGRVIIGQIHASGDEPLRLYYRHRAGQTNGCIYFAHEIRDSDDEDFYMIGNEACTSGPSNGIALGELFSYTITNDDNEISVVIRRGDYNGSIIATETINMDSLNSGYDRSDEWMYFKAGAYTQNNSGNGSDGDIVTFYRLSKSHDAN